MGKHVRKRAGRVWILGVTAGALVAGAAWASGSVSPAGATSNSYNIGKTVFASKVACDRCPFAGRGQAKDDARALIGELASAKDLTERERDAVIAYLKRRHRLS